MTGSLATPDGRGRIARVLPFPLPASPVARVAIGIAAVVALHLAVSFVAGAALLAAGFDTAAPGNARAVSSAVSIKWPTLLDRIAKTAIVEELVFRAIPLGMLLWVSWRLGMPRAVRLACLVAAAVLTSVAYGLFVGGTQAAAFHAAGGVVLAMAFLAVAGTTPGTGAVLAVPFVIACHVAVDLTVASTLRAMSALGLQ